jgi:hypothetical protein
MTILDVWFDSTHRLTTTGTRRQIDKIARRVRKALPGASLVTYSDCGMTPSQITVLQAMADQAEADMLQLMELAQ